MNDTHRCLLRYQRTGELERKAMKAKSKSNLWVQEEIDLGVREAAETAEKIGWEYDKYSLYVGD